MHRSLLLCLMTVWMSAQAGSGPAPQAAFADPGIAPDGSEIAFVSGGDIWTVPSAGGDARLIVSHAATDFRNAGLITGAQRGQIVSAAAKSSCGH